MNTKKLTLTAVFTAVAIALSTLENLVPISAFIPIPGLKLGIANLAMMSAYYIIGRKYAFFVGFLKVLTVFLTFGNVTSLLISFTGTTLAFLSLMISEKVSMKLISFIGVSAFSAIFHAAGQIIAACIITGSTAPAAIFLPLGLCSIATGALTGMIMNLFYPVIKNKTEI